MNHDEVRQLAAHIHGWAKSTYNGEPRDSIILKAEPLFEFSGAVLSLIDELEKAREALKPFAKAYESYTTVDIRVATTEANFRRAAELLNNKDR